MEYLEAIINRPKSSIFINGILDNLVKELEASKRIIKAGRGLM